MERSPKSRRRVKEIVKIAVAATPATSRSLLPGTYFSFTGQRVYLVALSRRSNIRNCRHKTQVTVLKCKIGTSKKNRQL